MIDASPLQWPVRWPRSQTPLTVYMDRFLDSFYCLPNGCWQWRNTNTHIYGSIWFGGRSIRAHRFSYLLFCGQLVDGNDLDHLCRNRGCVNPMHLEQVSRSINIKRGNLGTRWNQATCAHGHPRTPENTKVGIDRRRDLPKSECRLCHNRRQALRARRGRRRTS